MDNAEAESVRRNRYFEPQAGIVQCGNPGRPGGDRHLREHADGVVEAVALCANLMGEASFPEWLQHRFGSGRDELDQRNDVWVVTDDGVGDALAASAHRLAGCSR